MGRRLKIGIGILGLLLAAGVTLVLTHPGDGLDWVRKYGGQETISEEESLLVNDTGGDYYYIPDPTTSTFYFQKIPPELIAEINKKGRLLWKKPDPTYRLPPSQMASVSEAWGTVTITQPRGNYMSQMWLGLLTRLGFR